MELEQSTYCCLDKGSSSKFCVGPRVRHETLEKSWRTHRPKRYVYINKDDDGNLNTLSDKNIQATTVEQTGFFSLGIATSIADKKNTEFKNALVLHPTHQSGL